MTSIATSAHLYSTWQGTHYTLLQVVTGGFSTSRIRPFKSGMLAWRVTEKLSYLKIAWARRSVNCNRLSPPSPLPWSYMKTKMYDTSCQHPWLKTANSAVHWRHPYRLSATCKRPICQAEYERRWRWRSSDNGHFQVLMVTVNFYWVKNVLCVSLNQLNLFFHWLFHFKNRQVFLPHTVQLSPPSRYPSHLDPNISFSTMFSNTFNLCYPVSVKDKFQLKQNKYIYI